MTAITDQVLWRRVLNHVAADLKMLASLAAGSEIIVNQATAADLVASVQQLPGVVGVWPPAGYTTIIKDHYQNGVGPRDVYQVDPDRILYITSCWLTSRLVNDGSEEGWISLKDIEDAKWATLIYHRYDKAGQQTTVQQFFPAIKLIEGDTFYIQSNDADLDLRGGFHGFEVDA